MLLGVDTPKIEAPLLSYGGKPELIKLGIDLGVDFSHTWSCHTYVPLEKSGADAQACGTCGNCKTRYSAFEEIGYKDPLSYEVKPLTRTLWAGKQKSFDSMRKEMKLDD